jgi:hypothetical protein
MFPTIILIISRINKNHVKKNKFLSLLQIKMSQDFKKCLVRDERLNVTDAIHYAVVKGGQNVTPSPFNAVSQSPSSITFNVQVPSEQTLIDRRVLWQSTVVLALTVVAPAGQMPINYGLTDALSPFPLHQLASVMTSTINNNSVSINIRDVLPSLLRFNDRRELQRYNGYCPVAYDLVQSYPSAVGANLNMLGGWANAADNDLLPRGAWVLDAVSTTAPAAGGTISTIVAPVVSTGAAQTIYVQFTCTEPLLLSPWIFANPDFNGQGMYGVQNLNYQFNMGDASRVWRTAAGTPTVIGGATYPIPWITSTSTFSFNNTKLLFNFLTPHPSDLMPARNVMPYYELPRFITSNLSQIAANTSYGFPNITTTTVSTSSLQLNQIPDKLIISVRQPFNTLQYSATASANALGGAPDSFLCIKGVSINFNNMSGILSAASQQDLYRYSVENGSNQSWQEFSGYANIPDGATGVGRAIACSGSLLVLQFGKDIQLSEDFYASGSLGNFNLQVNLQVYNQAAYPITPEICLITMNSGLFVNERGTSSTYTGILTKQDVLDASAMEPYHMSDVKRMVGGGFLDNLKAVMGRFLPKARQHLASMDHPYAKAASHALGSMGYGKSGGGGSGGRLEDRLRK